MFKIFTNDYEKMFLRVATAISLCPIVNRNLLRLVKYLILDLINSVKNK